MTLSLEIMCTMMLQRCREKTFLRKDRREIGQYPGRKDKGVEVLRIGVTMEFLLLSKKKSVERENLNVKQKGREVD